MVKVRGPFKTWESAAYDALEMKRKIMPEKWTIEATLDFLEKYNGLGYRKYHKNVKTPYLWSGSQHYTKGKYVLDGKFDNDAVSRQLGAALILKRLGY